MLWRGLLLFFLWARIASQGLVDAGLGDACPKKSATAPLHVSIESWRWLPHSYAIIGSNLALALRKMQLRGEGNVKVSFSDAAPLHIQSIDWRSKRYTDLFLLEDTLLLADIPLTADVPYSHSPVPDVVFKIAFPFNTSTGTTQDNTSSTEKPFIFTYGTVESKYCPPQMLSEDSPKWEDVQVRMVTPSQWSADGLHSCGVPRNKIDIIPNGYDEHVFYPPSTAERRRA